MIYRGQSNLEIAEIEQIYNRELLVKIGQLKKKELAIKKEIVLKRKRILPIVILILILLPFIAACLLDTKEVVLNDVKKTIRVKIFTSFIVFDREIKRENYIEIKKNMEEISRDIESYKKILLDYKKTKKFKKPASDTISLIEAYEKDYLLNISKFIVTKELNYYVVANRFKFMYKDIYKTEERQQLTEKGENEEEK